MNKYNIGNRVAIGLGFMIMAYVLFGVTLILIKSPVLILLIVGFTIVSYVIGLIGEKLVKKYM
jgi:hypothetical protein